MALKKSPRGLIRPYTREGVTPSLKKTAKDMASIQSANKSLRQLSRLDPRKLTEEEAEDAMVDVELAAMQVSAAAKLAAKKLKGTLKKVEKYLAEASE